MRDKARERIDYAPGPAAVDAIEAAVRAHPRLNKQAVLDRLVVYGWWVLHRPQPTLPGNNRDRWRLPDMLRPNDDPGT